MLFMTQDYDLEIFRTAGWKDLHRPGKGEHVGVGGLSRVGIVPLWKYKGVYGLYVCCSWQRGHQNSGRQYLNRPNKDVHVGVGGLCRVGIVPP